MVRERASMTKVSPASRRRALDRERRMNDLGEYAHIFDGIPTWRGMAPPGYTVDFLGTLTATDFLQSIAEQSGPQSFYSVDLDDAAAPKPPALGDGRNGERWFEAVGWITAAREARDRFVMMSLGRMPCSANATICSPLFSAATILCGSVAVMVDVPGSIMPKPSAMADMVDAVPITLHAPEPQDMQASSSRQSFSEMPPVR